MKRIVNDIRKLYELFYPFGTFTDAPSACYMIIRELKNICKSNDKVNLLALILISKQLGFNYSPDTNTARICQDIQDWLYDRCFQLPDLDKTRFIVGLKTGNVPTGEIIPGKTVYILVNVNDLDNSIETREELEEYAVRGVYESFEDALHDLVTDEYAVMRYFDINDPDDPIMEQYMDEFIDITRGLQPGDEELYEIFQRTNWTIIGRELYNESTE